MHAFFQSLAARFLRMTTIVDRAAQRFDRLRTLVVLAFASERFFDVYGQIAFGRTSAYTAGTTTFRRDLFTWEADTIGRFFPPPPARILIGGAGGGREAFALIERGYEVVAFEPSAPLVVSMRRHVPREYWSLLDARRGSYQDLPVLAAGNGRPALDLTQSPPFDAVILGWTSLSHIPTDEGRRAALASCARLTRGPILASYFYQARGAMPAPRPMGMLARRAARWGPSMFTPMVGYCRLLSDEDVVELAASAGLEVVFLEREKAWPHAVLRAKGT